MKYKDYFKNGDMYGSINGKIAAWIWLHGAEYYLVDLFSDDPPEEIGSSWIINHDVDLKSVHKVGFIPPEFLSVDYA